MPEGRPDDRASRDILDSWKSVAAYLRRDVRTVMRWERLRELPVHRAPGGGRGGVYAVRSELDGWLSRTHLHLVSAPALTAAGRREPSIAVLPFANLSADKENEYFGDGLADEIITEIQPPPGPAGNGPDLLLFISRQASRRARNRRAIGGEQRSGG